MHDKPAFRNVKNILFDFGGVIFDIDFKRCEQAFFELGLKDGKGFYAYFREHRIFEKLETATITEAKFRDCFRMFLPPGITDDQIDMAWNALLIDGPKERYDFLKSLKQRYRIFMLSNSNSIHFRHYLPDFRAKTGLNDFDQLFEKAYFSYRIGHKKPDAESFQHVLNDSHLEPAETLFVDDSEENTLAAAKLGIRTLTWKPGDDLSNLLDYLCAS